eukprot:SAG11_NODE_68_length_18649_cov_29.058005_10_plen_86_part_00
MLQNFGNSLNDQETERLFTSLVCDYVRIPMLMQFFDRDRLTTLCSGKLRALLDGIVSMGMLSFFQMALRFPMTNSFYQVHLERLS